VGTAHGLTLENLLLNPTLADLVGGIQPVTLGDEEARRRGTQKTVLERKGPPTFDVLVELRGRDEVAVYPDVAETVDGLLRDAPPAVEVRRRAADGGVERRLELPPRPAGAGVARRTAGGGRVLEGESFRDRAAPATGSAFSSGGWGHSGGRRGRRGWSA
jgi:hypothetical protein